MTLNSEHIEDNERERERERESERERERRRKEKRKRLPYPSIDRTRGDEDERSSTVSERAGDGERAQTSREHMIITDLLHFSPSLYHHLSLSLYPLIY